MDLVDRWRLSCVACLLALLRLTAWDGAACAGEKAEGRPRAATQYQCATLRAAIEDLIDTYGARYPNGARYLKQLDALEAAMRAESGPAATAGPEPIRAQLEQLRREALLANPLLAFDKVLLVKRKSMRDTSSTSGGKVKIPNVPGADLGFPSNHECNSSLPREGYDNEITILSLAHPDAPLTTLYRPDTDVYVGEMDLDWDARRLLFTQSDRAGWKVWEIGTDGSGRRRVSQTPADVDCFDACYMPGGRIVFGSTAPWQAVPCWHGLKLIANLYTMNADGSDMRQICFDQDHDLHPVILNDGRVLYQRWDYTGINHIFLRELMTMNPDGTNQRAAYGINSWYPNALYFPRPLPGDSSRVVCILSGYHGVHKMGQLVLVDTDKGWYEADGIVKRISGKGDPIHPVVRDQLVDKDWPKFLHPYPLSDKYFLVACWPDAKSRWGIYLADVFDNLVLLREEPGYALLEPVPILARPKPPVITDKVDLRRTDGVAYLHNVYSGSGLAGVPQGVVKSLRVIAYDFGYPGLAGPDLVGWGGPWEVMRILGTVPLEEDGSIVFRVPANTPIAVQALDAQGRAVQLMRSWFTVKLGETLSCVGCHETPADVTPSRRALAAVRDVREIQPWRGPARGFDFAREVQPVLNKYCVACHDGRSGRPDLRSREQVPGYQGRRLSKLGVERMHPKMLAEMGGLVKYTPAYEALVPYIRRVGIEDDVRMLVPGEYHADTSELIQMLRKGHQGVRLDAQAWDRLTTWIDLNGPCHGTWGEVYPIPDGAHQRRMELRKAYGGPSEDPEVIPDRVSCDETPVQAQPLPEPNPLHLTAESSPPAGQLQEKTVELAAGVTMRLVRIPAGSFIMGDAKGEPDEAPLTRVRIDKPFWMGVYEVTNEQFRLFDPRHDSGYYQKRHARSDDEGLSLNGPGQPVVRVSWEQAAAFCRWLSQRTGLHFTLPTEAQWEYACRAGAATPLYYGDVDTDFSAWANLADLSFGDPEIGKYNSITGGLEHLVLEGAARSDRRFTDGFVVTAPVGVLRPNAWGLYDMHGNAAEWTDTSYALANEQGRKVVRGGSFFDRPARARSGFRQAYPSWQRVFNVGFRVICP